MKKHLITGFLCSLMFQYSHALPSGMQTNEKIDPDYHADDFVIPRSYNLGLQLSL